MSHPPKIRALIAEAEGRLSQAGSARLARHLERCSDCRRAQTAQIRYEQLRGAALDEPAPKLEWEAFERSLDQPARIPLGPRRRPWMAAGLAAAAAIGLAIVRLGASPQLDASAAPTPKAAVAVVAPTVAQQTARTGELSLISGTVEVAEGTGPYRPAALHMELHAGMRIRTSTDSEAHATLASGSALALDADTELTVAELGGNEVELALNTGRVRSSVAHLAEGEHYEVRTPEGYRARVRGTRFSVAHHAHETQVEVSEGVVEVLAADVTLASLVAGQTFASHGAAPDEADVTAPHAPELAPEVLGGLILPRLPQAQSYVVYGQAYPAREGLALRAPLGALQLGVVNARGQLKTLPVQISSRTTQLSLQRLLALLTAKPAALPVREEELGPDAVRPVVRNGIGALRRCYERSLEREPNLSAHLTLLLSVTPEGRIGQAVIAEMRKGKHGGGLPADLSRCVVRVVRTWQFPAPGNHVDLEV
ncbi:MAG: hypothetical protein RL385_4545, partial [Pseudomonadota bacterium]